MYGLLKSMDFGNLFIKLKPKIASAYTLLGNAYYMLGNKEKALALLQQDTIEMQEVSKRWASDMQSDSWLSKNTRPLALIFLTISMVVLIFVDSTGGWFDVDSGWVDLLKSLLITVYVAYFGSRGAEKFKSIQKNG